MNRLVLAEFDVFFHENFTTGVRLHAESKNRIYYVRWAIFGTEFWKLDSGNESRYVKFNDIARTTGVRSILRSELRV
jgi:hypothetical protein